MTLWYRQAAPQWDHAMPLGNGRLGAMVFGSVNRERIQLNEDTLWMGGPRETDNPEARAALPEVRRLLFAGKPREAYALAEKKLMGKPWRLESYQTLGDLRLNFDYEEPDHRLSPRARSRYGRRTRHLSRQRRALHARGLRLASRSGDRRARHRRPARVRCRSACGWIARRTRQRASPATIASISTARSPAARDCRSSRRRRSFRTAARSTRSRSASAIDNANAVTIVLAARTSFAARIRSAAVDRDLAARGAKPYAQLLADHIADHQRLFRRVDVRLGAPAPPEIAALPTDERLERVKKGDADPGLDALYLPVRPLPADRQQPPRRSAREPAGPVERQHEPAVGHRLSPQHQPADELLAGRGDQPRRAARAALRLPRVAARAGPQDGADALRRARLRRASHHRHLGLHVARRSAALRPLADRRRLADAAPLGALPVRPGPRVPAARVSDDEGAAEFFLDYLVAGSERAGW